MKDYRRMLASAGLEGRIPIEEIVARSAEGLSGFADHEEAYHAAYWDRLALLAEREDLLTRLEEKDDQIHRLREVRDDLADALHELECGWWATGTVPEMMEAVRVIVRGTVDRATEGGRQGSPDN